MIKYKEKNMSECFRCGRDLKDPNAIYGWRCAKSGFDGPVTLYSKKYY